MHYRTDIATSSAAKMVFLLGVFLLPLSQTHSQEISFQKQFDMSPLDMAYCVRQTPDSGYVIAGQFTTNETHSIVIRTNRYGDTLWTRSIPSSNTVSIAVSVTAVDSGDFVVAGNPGFRVSKVSSDGVLKWTKTYVADDSGAVFAMTPTLDGGFVLAGTRRSPNVYDLYILKVDRNGDSLWAKMLGGPVPPTGVGVNATSDSGCIVIGSILGQGSYPYSAFLARITYQGDSVWTKSLFTDVESYGRAVQQTSDGGFIAAGSVFDPGAGNLYDGFLVKTDPTGDTVWTKFYENAPVTDVSQTADSGYIVAGQMEVQDTIPSPYVLKMSGDGTTEWIRQLTGSAVGSASSVRQTSDNGYVITGEVITNQQQINWDIFLLKTNSVGVVSVGSKTNSIPQFRLAQNFPNPFNPTTTISYALPRSSFVTITIYNTLGQQVARLVNEQQQPGYHDVVFRGEQLASGVYFYRLQADNFLASKKLLLLK